MKKIFSAIACAAALFTVSCVKDEVYDNGLPAGGDQTIPMEFRGLVLNELNGNDKFIELYNKGTEAIRLQGVYIEKDGTNVWEAGDITLEAGGYLLLYSEDVIVEQHPEYDGTGLVFASGLSSKKAVRVQLFTPSGVSLDDFNLVDYSVPAPASYSRNPDGTGDWVYAAATPGAANAPSNDRVTGLAEPETGNTDDGDDSGDDDGENLPGGPTAADVVLNEIDGNAKFIELYNNGTEAVSLAGYQIVKNEEETVWTGAGDLTIEASGYLVLYSNKADNVAEVEASLVFAAGLSAKQSLKLELLDAGSASVDTYVRGGSPYGETLPENKKASFSRVPDGTGEWAYATPTPGEANGAKTGDIEQE